MSTKQNDTNTDETRQTFETPIKPVPEPMEGFTDNAIHNILPARYLLRNADGDLIETPEELFTRIAQNVAKGEITEEDEEKWAVEFQRLMETQQFIPNSPCLMNAGAPLQQLSACFVVEPEDDMESIFDSAKKAALIFKSGGGVGYTFSHLRPHGAMVASTGGESSGPLSFMEVFNAVCNTVKQGGKRRGAQMAILRVDHADIGRFACSKRTEGDFDNFNISVAVTDEFKTAVQDNESYTFYTPETDFEEAQPVLEATANFFNPEFENNPIDWEDMEKNGREGKLVKENVWRDYADDIMAWDPEAGEKVPLAEKWQDQIHLEVGEPMELPARFIFDIIIDGAWRNGEPGLFYLDETNRDHSFDVDEYPEHAINATNPCAEQPLSNFEACNLGHINLSLMLNSDASTFGQWLESQDRSFRSEESKVWTYVDEVLNYERFNHVIDAGTRFLDDVVTMSDFPLPEITERVKGQRKIGLGIMGFAQLLFQMGLPYGSPESYLVAQKIMRHIDYESKQSSHSLALERGSFEYWEESKYANPTQYPEWFEKHTYLPAEDYEDGFPIRNHNTTTIAPTGTTSMLANTTGGCEPAFNVVNYKNVGDDIQGNDMLVEFDDYFAQTLAANGYDPEEVKAEAMDLMAENKFEGPHDLSIPSSLADIFLTTNEISSRCHAEMQRSFQAFVDSGISKTINAPNSATRDDVYDAFMLALADEGDEIGCPAKGLTFYRDGSRDEQVLTVRRDNNLDEQEDEAPALEGKHLDVLQKAQVTLLDQGDDGENIAKALGAIIRGDEGVSGDDLCPECGEEMDPDGEGCYLCPGCFFSPCR